MKAIPLFWEQKIAAGGIRTEELAQSACLRDTALTETIYSGGLRISEAVGLNFGDIDLAQGIMSIRERAEKNALPFWADRR